jgi:hypothetical protein
MGESGVRDEGMRGFRGYPRTPRTRLHRRDAESTEPGFNGVFFLCVLCASAVKVVSG